MSCSRNQKEFDKVLNIEDINSDEIYTAASDLSENSNVFEVRYCFVGSSSDTLLVNEHTLIGRIDTCFKHDWYSREIKFQLQSNDTLTGELEISVDFNYLTN